MLHRQQLVPLFQQDIPGGGGGRGGGGTWGCAQGRISIMDTSMTASVLHVCIFSVLGGSVCVHVWVHVSEGKHKYSCSEYRVNQVLLFIM